MKYESIKTFILVVLIFISFVLSYIVWSYQPNFDYLSEESHVSEIDVGGEEKTKNELVEPIKIAFKNEEHIKSFKEPEDRREMYKDMAAWVMDDVEETKTKGRPDANQYVELVFPTAIPAPLLTNLFTFDDEVNLPNWDFERVFMIPEEESKSIKVVVLSEDHKQQLKAKINKTEAYNTVQSYVNDENDSLEDSIVLDEGSDPIYLPASTSEWTNKTVVASSIDSELFVNALFPNPSLVTMNTGEGYFTDGQRGMEVTDDGRKLEYINPLETNYERIDSNDLLDISVNHMNEHEGWTNNFMFSGTTKSKNNIRFRLTYNGLPVYDQDKYSVIEQEWRDDDLHQYNRPLIEVGSLLNEEDTELSSGEEVRDNIAANPDKYNLTDIKDVRIGYYMDYSDDTHSLTLEASWFIQYSDDWVQLDEEELDSSNTVEEED